MGEHEEEGSRFCVHCGVSFDVHDALAPRTCPASRFSDVVHAARAIANAVIGEPTPYLDSLRTVPRRSNFDAVGDFHEKFGLPNTTHHKPFPHLLNIEAVAFRLKFLHEELEELEAAVTDGNLPEIADALVDLVYVALGTAHLYGLPWQDLFDEVQYANMQKERAASDGSNSKRGSSLDVIKPPGWEPPDIEKVLTRNGWQTQTLRSFEPFIFAGLDGTKIWICFIDGHAQFAPAYWYVRMGNEEFRFR